MFLLQRFDSKYHIVVVDIIYLLYCWLHCMEDIVLEKASTEYL